MAEISLCMIVKNEEKNLAVCLNSIAGIADEINIVDTGSTDRTVEVAKQFTDRVFYFEWIDDFAAARNFSFAKATKDFIMWLDADDVLTQIDRERIIKIKSILNDNIDYVIMQYRIHENKDGEVSLIFPKARITRRAMGFQWKGAIHEDLRVSGRQLFVEIFIEHKYKDTTPSLMRNKKILEKMIDSNQATYRDHYFYGLTLYLEDNYVEALRYLNMVVESGHINEFDPIELFLVMHNLYRIFGDVDSAQTILEDNEYLMSDKSEYYCTLGEFYLDYRHDSSKARDLYKQALKCEGTFRIPGVPAQRKPEFYYYIPNRLLGRVYVSLKEPESALAHYERALSYKKNEEIEQLTVKLKKIIQLQKSETLLYV